MICYNFSLRGLTGLPRHWNATIRLPSKINNNNN